jgi:RNA polymerase sigma-70 factor (ECF subfamily)
MPEATQILLNLCEGDRSAVDRLMPLVYDDFHAVAARQLAGERRGYTLQPTELVHEAYLRLTNQARVQWKSRMHFLAIGAQVIRRILLDYARNRGRAKRGGGIARVELNESVAAAPQRNDDREALGEALKRLATLDPRQARIVEMRFVGGMTVDEIATATGLSKRTIEGEWAMARAWLRHELTRGGQTHSRD